jgi:O-antigen/teichoic acid export membrane protein
MQRPEVVHLIPRSSIYASPDFPIVTLVLGFTILFQGAESATVSLNVRRLNFRPIFVLDLISRLLPIPVTIAWAYLSPSIWSIVGGVLFGSLLRLVLSHTVVPGPCMRFHRNLEHVKEIVSFGKWINLSSFATFIGSQSDIIILGILLPGSALGLYYVAKTLKDSVENLLERLNSMMTLSVLGEVARNEPTKVSAQYYRFRLPIELVAASSGGFLFAAADTIVHFLYDSRYHDAGEMLRILSVSLLLYPISLIRSAFTVVGEAYITAWISVVKAIAVVTFLALGYWLAGSTGAIAGSVLSRSIPSLAILLVAHRKRWIVFSNEIRLLPAAAVGLATGQLAVYALGSLTLTDLRHFLSL